MFYPQQDRQTPRRRFCLLKGLLAAFAVLVLTGCQLQLRKPDPLPYTTIYTNIDLNTDFGNQLRLAIQALSPHTRLVNRQSGAQLQLIKTDSEQIKHLTSINPSGQADEYELIYRFTYTLLNASGRTELPETTIRRSLFVSYDATQASAESQKITLIFNDLQMDVIPVLINQLNATKTRQMLSNKEPYYGQ